MGWNDIKRDCFAYENQFCKALDDLYCRFEDCVFYKTMKQRCDGCKQAVGRTMDCAECRKRNLK